MLYPYAQVNQLTAREACQEFGGDLLTIASAQENTALRTALSNWSDRRMWIGLMSTSGQPTTNRSAYAWVASGNTPAWSNWDAAQPDNDQGAQGVCVVAAANSSNAWQDVGCNKKLGFGCEIGKFSWYW